MSFFKIVSIPLIDLLLMQEQFHNSVLIAIEVEKIPSLKSHSKTIENYLKIH